MLKCLILVGLEELLQGSLRNGNLHTDMHACSGCPKPGASGERCVNAVFARVCFGLYAPKSFETRQDPAVCVSLSSIQLVKERSHLTTTNPHQPTYSAGCRENKLSSGVTRLRSSVYLEVVPVRAAKQCCPPTRTGSNTNPAPLSTTSLKNLSSESPILA